MIAVANKQHPLFSFSGQTPSQVARQKNKQSRRDGIKSTRAVNKITQEKQVAESAPRLKGTPSNKELKRADGGRRAAERKARNKAERLAKRPRIVVVDTKKVKVLKAAAVVIGILAGVAEAA